MEDDNVERILADLRQSADFAAASQPTPREDAVRLVREAMSKAVGLLPVTEAAAETICALTASWEVTVSLLDGGQYWDVVDVCAAPTTYPRFPDARYPTTDYPIGTERVLAGEGYISGGAADEVLAEYERQWPDVPVGSILGVPIVALGEVHSEVFLVRHFDTPPFGQHDLDFVSELAALFGARPPALVAAYKGPGGQVPGMHELTDRLNDHLQ